MVRYDASKDMDLQDAYQHALEKQFFLCQYRKRKFFTDKNVLFDDGEKEDVKNSVNAAFSCSEMNYNGVIELYENLVRKIRKNILFHTFVELNIYKDSLHKNLSQKVHQVIDDLQWYIAYYNLNLFKREIEPNIADPELCENLLKDINIVTMVMKLTLISVRYGLLITDLCSFQSGIDIKPSIDENDLTLYRIFSHCSDFDPRINPHVLLEDESLQKTRILNFLEAIKGGSEIKRVDASAVKKELKNIIHVSFYSNSILKRRAGLWLWDNCDSPLTEIKMKTTEAIEVLSKHNLFKGRKKDSLYREIFRVYDVTKRSIAAGEILPIEDGKKKNK